VRPAGAAVADRVTLVGLTNDDKLVTFTSDGPSTLVSTVAVTGLATGEHLVDIGFRPANAALYGVGTASRLYSLNRSTGAATAIGTTVVSPALSGTFFGLDFNPTVDRIRVVSDTGQNLRLNPDTGTVAATDTPLSYAAGDPAGAVAPHVTAEAYTNGFSGAGTTSLYGIDTSRDALVLQNPPNGGVLNTVGALGVDAGGCTRSTCPRGRPPSRPRSVTAPSPSKVSPWRPRSATGWPPTTAPWPATATPTRWARPPASS
jgi:hypothetical protein